MPFVAGNDVDAHCDDCGKDTAHTVIEAVSGVVREVRCKACTKVHPYQRPHVPKKAAPKKKAPRKTTKKKKAAAPKISPFEELLGDRDMSTATAYKIKSCFKLNEIISHPKFGIGIVSMVFDDKKIEVAFADETKKLIHDRS